MIEMLNEIKNLLEMAKATERMKDIPILIDDAIGIIEILSLSIELGGNLRKMDFPLDNE